MFAACMNICKGRFKQRIRSLTVTLMLTLVAVAVVLVAIGFGLSLLYVWLQQLYGTMPALAIIAGGCAVLALILFMIAFLRPASRPRVEAPEPATGSAQRSIEEAVAAVQQGSRESMLAALALALMAGVTVGRKL
jgi:type VI protein secretion system component VasK